VVARAIDIERHEHLLDFEGDSGYGGKFKTLLAGLHAWGLRAGVSRSWCSLVTGVKRSSSARIWRSVAQSVENRKDEIQSSARFKLSATLNATFLSTNHMENVMGITVHYSRNGRQSVLLEHKARSMASVDWSRAAPRAGGL
jgi:hypothetical protein